MQTKWGEIMALSVENKESILPSTLEIVRDNIVKYGNPLGLKSKEVAKWARGLNLPQKGEVLFYTGGEYQLAPYIDGLIDMLTRMDQKSNIFSLMIGMRNAVDRVTGINPEKIIAGMMCKDKDRYQEINLKAAKVLNKFGFEFCYLGEKELYSGALLYEYGFIEDLMVHARKLADNIRSTGATTIICTSPHAAEVFKFVYPELLGDFSYEVKTFFEVVYEKMKDNDLKLESGKNTFTIHDSCRMARELGITEEIRQLLGWVRGVEVVEPQMNREWTSCCGGTSKVLFPALAEKIAQRRIGELTETGAEKVLTFCPYCLSALERAKEEESAAIQLKDFIEFIYEEVMA